MVRSACWAATVSCLAAIVLSGCGATTSDAGSKTTPPGALATQPADLGTGAPTTATPTAAPTPTPTAAPTATPTAATATTTPAKADLDAYIAAARRQMKAMLPASYAQVYSDIRLKPVYPSGVKYIYVLMQAVDMPEAKARLETTVPVLKALFDTQIAPEMRRQGFAEPSATWEYLDPDGSRIWTHTES